MKHLIALLFLFVSVNCFSQSVDKKELTEYSFTVGVDSIVTPDSYKIYFSISEYNVFVKVSRNKRERVIVSCDSIYRELDKQLKSYGFNDSLLLSNVTSRKLKDDYYAEKKKVEVYFLEVDTEQEARKIYKSIQIDGLVGVKIKGHYDKQTKLKIETELREKAILEAKKVIQKYADENDFKITHSNYLRAFVGSSYRMYNDFDNRPLYEVDFSKYTFEYSVNASYNLEKKETSEKNE